MEYSKITSVEVINFMSFKKAKVVFDETGIINLKGYNDSGKSAILRAIAVCLMDKYRSKHAKFIRHGEEYFRIVVSFDDGVSIIRDKYINGQSLYEVYKDGDCIFTTKQGNKLSKVDGVPKPIQDYLGLCVTDSTYLNYQTNEEKLPVVDTTGSENYQMFHEVLRMEEIYRANNMINTDKNELGAQIASIEVELQREEVLLERCGDVSEDFIREIEKLEDNAKATEKKKDSLIGISDAVARYDRIPVIPSIEKVSTDRLKSALAIGSIVSGIESVVSLPSIPKVSSERLSILEGIDNALNHLKGYVDIPEVPKVDSTLLVRSGKLSNLANTFQGTVKQAIQCRKVDEELSELKKTLNELVESARSQGIEFVKCDNCGSYTVVGGGHAHE